MSYLLLIVVTLVLGLGSQAWINSAYKKWSAVRVASGMTGAEAARNMLDAYGLYNMRIEMIAGNLTDNFDPRTNVLHLSQDTYNGRSVAATAVACHEAGHAVQHATGYAPIKVRGAIVPVVSFASNIWIFILIAGFILNMLSLVWVAIIMYACVVVFQLVTLPVEFDASRRALSAIEANFALPAEQNEGAAKVLKAAAFTYVAGALASILQLLYFVGMARRD